MNIYLYQLSWCFPPALEKKREENYRNVAFKSRPCLNDIGVSLEGFSGMQIIFRFLSTAAAFFVYFFLLK
jgi:hypothetical protein